MSDALKVRNRLYGTLGIEEPAAVDCQLDFEVVFDKAADDGMASTTTSDTKVWSNPFEFPCQIVGIAYSATGGGITANDTNYAQIQAKADDGAGGATAVGAQLETKITAGTGNISANVTVRNNTLLSGSMVPVGANVFVAIAKQGSGVVVRAGKIVIRLRKV